MNLSRSRLRVAKHSHSAIPGSRACGKDAYLLIEYLIYIGVVAVVIGVAFSAFYRFLDHSRAMNRTSEDILKTLAAGELWRADIRQAAASPDVRTNEELIACEILKTNTQIVAYIFSKSSVWRMETNGALKEILPRVKHSRIFEDRYENVRAWRWEIELSTRKKVVRLRPLFSFQAVPLQPMP